MAEASASQKTQLLTRVWQLLRLKHYSIRTKDADVQVVKRFILFQQKRHPREMSAEEIRQYLSHLANQGRSPLLPRTERLLPCSSFIGTFSAGN